MTRILYISFETNGNPIIKKGNRKPSFRKIDDFLKLKQFGTNRYNWGKSIKSMDLSLLREYGVSDFLLNTTHTHMQMYWTNGPQFIGPQFIPINKFINLVYRRDFTYHTNCIIETYSSYSSNV